MPFGAFTKHRLGANKFFHKKTQSQLDEKAHAEPAATPCESTAPASSCSINVDSPQVHTQAQQQTFIRNPDGRLTLGPYEVRRTLGAGMQAKVVLAKNVQQGTYVALKVIDRATLSLRYQEQINREIVALRAVSHPNVLKLQDLIYEARLPASDPALSREAIVLVLDLCTGGELFDLMLYTGGFSETVARTYFLQLAGAVSACHAAGVYHRDLKPQNILLDSKFQLKVADFGLSALHAAGSDLCYTYCGTRSYMAPEVLAGQAYSGAKADAWSLGVLLFILLAGTPPLRSATSDDWWFKAILLGRIDKFWQAHEQMTPGFPRSAQGIIGRLLVANPQDRAAVDDLASDPWLAGETVAPDALFQEMVQRKRAAEDRKAAAHAEALARKQAAAAQEAAASGAAPFDSFAARTHRALDGDLTPPPLAGWQQQDDVARAFGAAFGGRAQGFYVLLRGCMQTLGRVQKACEGAGATEVTRADVWELRVTFLSDPPVGVDALPLPPLPLSPVPAEQEQHAQPLRRRTALELQVQLYTAVLGGQELAFVKVERRAGDVFAAKAAERAIMAAMGSAAVATESDGAAHYCSSDPLMDKLAATGRDLLSDLEEAAQ